MERLIAYCGLVCNECPAYLATQADDDSERTKIAAEWSEAFGSDFKKEDINCDGCLGTGRHAGKTNKKDAATLTALS